MARRPTTDGGQRKRRGRKVAKISTRRPPRNSAPVAELRAKLKRRTEELRDAFEQQRATAEILRTIAAAPTDVDQSLRRITETTARFFGASSVTIRLTDGKDWIRAIAVGNASERVMAALPADQLRIGGNSLPSVVVLENRQLHIPDVDNVDPSMAKFPGLIPARAGGTRTMSGTPLRRGDRVIGVLIIHRDRLAPFTEEELALQQSFADQAVIAIENARLFNEKQEALERQTATAEILKVIASSPSDVAPVFEAIATSANRLIGGFSTAVHVFVDDMVHLAAFTPTNPASDAALKAAFPVKRSEMAAVALVEKGEIAQVADAEIADAYTRRLARARGWRSVTFTPLMNRGTFIGFIACTRLETGELADHHLQLLRTFADQAVIAIENTRLFNETKEALEQQTATSDILAAINGSGGDLAPVFECILEKAHHLCGAPCGSLQLYQDGHVVPVAIRGMTPAFAEFLRRGYPITEGIRDGLFANHPVQRADMIDFLNEQPDELSFRASVELGGIRTIVWVPLLRDGVAFGRIVAARQEVRPFDEKQIATLQGFAAQAVIAIENARLLQELRARTDDLGESLQQQTATADVLKVIGRSAFDLNQVFETVVESSVRLCEADRAIIFRFDGELLRVAHVFNAPHALGLWLEGNPIRPGRHSVAARAALERRTIQVEDVRADFEHSYAAKEIEPFRTVLGVPMLKGNDLLGVILVYHNVVKPFTDKQVLLVSTFAEQAAIAIENVRLFEQVQAKTRDLEEALQQQTATADVLKVISRSPDQLKPVLDVIVETSRELCDALTAVIFLLREDGRLHDVAESSTKPGYIEAIRANPISPDQRGSILARAVRQKRTVHIPNSAEDSEAGLGGPLDAGGPRSLLSVPLILDGRVIGGITLQHGRLSPFTTRQIEAVETFADQAVIAISNVNLFEQVQQRTRELSKSLDDLRTAQDRLVQTEKLASLGQLTAGIAHEIKNPLNFVNNFSALSTELIDELDDVMKSAGVDGKARGEIEEITKTLKANLEKVVQHGKRADSIVKNMLLHSREGSGELRPADINAIVEESLNLAYHGARAEKSGFNITLKRDLDPAAGSIEIYPQEITRVFLNLISNGFYATSKRRAESPNETFEPVLSATTRDLGKAVEIRIRDNGTGIPPEVREKIFNPFFTTKPAGEGTGLGLSMTHDIIVKQHGGRIDVETEPGSFTEFIITLPRDGGTATGPKSEP